MIDSSEDENAKKKERENFGIFTTVGSQGRPHSVGVVYSVSTIGQPFALYLITRSVLKKARNLQNNSNISFVVPFPRLLFRMIPPACIQFQGKAEIISNDDPIALKAFRSSIVLRRSMIHSTTLGQSIFIKIIPDDKIFCFGIGADIWDFLIPSRSKNLKSHYVKVPPNRIQANT